MFRASLLLQFAVLCTVFAQDAPTFGTTVVVPGGLTGAKLFIDGKPIVDADGLGRREPGGSVKLSSGIHQIRVPYFQGPRYHLCLILRVSRPGDPSFRVFDTDDFAPPLNEDPATPEFDARKPPLADRQEAVQRAAGKAAAYNASLPDFICNKILDRSENRSKHGWLPRDTLTIQLNYSGQKEDHKLVAQNGVPILADVFHPATGPDSVQHHRLRHDEGREPLLPSPHARADRTQHVSPSDAQRGPLPRLPEVRS
jgi:hypothetical protein